MSGHMNDKNSRISPTLRANESKPLRFLGQSQIEMIDEALQAVGPFGEVQLIVEKGRLRFVVTKNSHDVLKWRPDSIVGEKANS